MNILVRDCLSKLSIVMKAKGNNWLDNKAFCLSLSTLCESKMAIVPDQSNAPSSNRHIVDFKLLTNKVNNDFLKDVVVFAQDKYDNCYSIKNPILNLGHNQEPIILEIKETAYEKFDVEELFAVIMNSITQSVMTTTSVARLVELINYVYENGIKQRYTFFNAYMFVSTLKLYLAINPYEMIIMDNSPLTAHDLMVEFELAEAYNEVLGRTRDNLKSISTVIEDQYKEDIHQTRLVYKFLKTDEENYRRFLDTFSSTYPYGGISEIIKLKIDKRNGYNEPSVSLDSILYNVIPDIEAANEGFFGVGNSYSYKRYRFKIDSVLIMIQNMEYNDEKQYIRNQIFKLEKELDNHAKERDTKIEKAKNDAEVKFYKQAYEGLESLSKEIALIREGLVRTKPTPKKVGIFIEYPPGWEG